MINQKEKNFKLDNFEGPLDLLLHLIRDKKMDILEISLVNVADQYIEYIEKAQKVNLEIAAEYLVIASTLVEIKAKHMLKETTNEKTTYEEKPEELINRLIEYEKYKNASKNLLDLYNSYPQFDKDDDDFISFMEKETDIFVALTSNGKSDIIDAFHNIKSKLKDLKPITTKIINNRISPEERKKEIENIINENGNTTFLSIVKSNNRYYIAVTLLVLLEMANSGTIDLVQKEDMSDIKILVVK